MESSFKKLPESAVELTVDMDLTEFKTYYARAFQAAKAGIEIKGFRKGMAPDTVVEGALDHQQLFNDAAERAIKTTLADSAEKNNWTIIDRPTIEIKDTDTSFSYVAKFSLFPEVAIDGFDAIAEKERAALIERKKKITVEEKETEDALAWLRKAATKEGEKEPELNDAFATKVGKFTTLAELKTSIMNGIREEKIRHEEEAACIAALEMAVKNAAIDIPRPMIKKIQEQDASITEETAKQKIAMHLVIYALAEKANIRPTEEEIQTEAAHFSNNLDAKKINGYIYERIQQKKVYDLILKNNE